MHTVPETIWTIGHSVHPIGVFVALLHAHGIEVVADVRRYAGSRRHPQFNRESLAKALADEGIGYEPFPDLGGRRSPRPDSPHTVWRNPSFRGYADYMDSGDFAAALDRLIAQAVVARTAIMCSEAVWWRCHRSMIADALKVRGIRVLHILDAGTAKEHPYTPAATVVAGELRYGDGP